METGHQLCYEVMKTLLKDHLNHGITVLEVLLCLFALVLKLLLLGEFIGISGFQTLPVPESCQQVLDWRSVSLDRHKFRFLSTNAKQLLVSEREDTWYSMALHGTSTPK